MPKKSKNPRGAYRGWWADVEVKPGVPLDDLTCEMRIAIRVFYEIYRALGKKLVVTSTTDGMHTQGSLHFSGNAADLRIWGLTPKTLEKIVSTAKVELGQAYYILLEKSHIHVQFDRQFAKKGRRGAAQRYSIDGC